MMSSDEEYVFAEEKEEELSVNGNSNSSNTVNEDDFVASSDEDVDDENTDGNGSYRPEDSTEKEEGESPIITTRRRTRGETRQCSLKTNEKISQVIQEERLPERKALWDLVPDVDKDYLYDTPSEDDDDDSGKAKRKVTSSFEARKRVRKKWKLVHENESDEEDNVYSKGEDEDGGGEFEVDERKVSGNDKSDSEENQLCCSIESEFDEEEEASSSYNTEEGESEDDYYGIGSAGDFYCCPLCYTEAYRRQGNLAGRMAEDDDNCNSEESENEGGSEENESGKDDNDPFAFHDDPMTVLRNVGFNIASTFCFHLLHDVKNHMKEVHGFDPSGMKGNGLFQRFQIRASDGLLQHWLTSRGSTNMWRYWGRRKHSNSKSFLDLSRMINKHRLKGGGSRKCVSSFSQSFPNRAKKVWAKVSDPYLKPENDDTEEMIDDRDVEEDLQPRPIVDDQDTDLEESLIWHLREINEELGNDDASDEQDGSSVLDDSSNISNVESLGEILDEEEEEEDPWMEAKLQKPKAPKRRRDSSREYSDDDNIFESYPSTANIVSPQKRILGSEDES